MWRALSLSLSLVVGSELHAQWVVPASYPVLPSPADPVAVNSLGAGVGYYSIPSPSGSYGIRFNTHSFVYLEAPAGFPYTGEVKVIGIDAQNVAFGSSRIDTQLSDATLWATSVPQLVSSLVTSGPSLDLHDAIGRLPSGAIVGTARLPGSNQVTRGFYLKNGILTEIFDANLMVTAIPQGFGTVGGQDVVVGFANTGTNLRAWTWTAGTFTLLPEPALPNVSTSAVAINSAGTVVGWYSTTPDPFTTTAYPLAAKWESGAFVDLHDISGFTSVALAINSAGDAVGYANIGSDSAVVWKSNQGYPLQSLVPSGTSFFFERAVSITDDGFIYGSDLLSGGFRARLCEGSFTTVGGSCGSFPVPKLEPGPGCPDAGQSMSLSISGGVPNAPGLFLLGSGNGALPFKPFCTLGVAPLLPVTLPFAVSGTGTLTIGATLPATLPPVTVYTQVLLAEPAAQGGVEASNVLRIDVQ